MECRQLHLLHGEHVSVVRREPPLKSAIVKRRQAETGCTTIAPIGSLSGPYLGFPVVLSSHLRIPNLSYIAACRIRYSVFTSTILVFEALILGGSRIIQGYGARWHVLSVLKNCP
jgi:hypothetical protein